MRRAAASFGRAVMVTLPLISALALSALMLTLPICLATLPPSRPLSASPTAPVAFDDSEPVTFSVRGQRGPQEKQTRGAGRRERAARRGPADVGVFQNLRHRIVGLACEGA